MRSICQSGALRPWGISGRGSLVVFYREVRMRPCKDRRRYAAMWPYVFCRTCDVQHDEWNDEGAECERCEYPPRSMRRKREPD